MFTCLAVCAHQLSQIAQSAKMKNDNKTKHVGKVHSLRKTPWDNKKNRTPLENFIMEHTRKTYENRHEKLKASGECEVLNDLKIDTCPYCGSPKFIKRGKNINGIQKYKCSLCYKIFNPLSGTLLDNHKLSIKEWIDWLRYIIRYQSFNTVSKDNKNSMTTTKYWLEKLFIALSDWQKTFVLDDVVYIDETYYSVVQNEIKRREDGTKYRGINNNQYDIAVGVDSKGLIYTVVTGKGKPSDATTKKAFSKHIKKGSTLIHDGELSHNSLIEKLELKSEVHTTEETSGLKDKDNPLKPINDVIRALKTFLNSHKGFNREHLQNYLNLFVFIYGKPHDEDMKVSALLQLLIRHRETLKYRDFFEKKVLKTEKNASGDKK